jgi:anaerobic selenocysteine-containing dehydrogenase
MKPRKRGGGWAAIRYTLRMANRVGWWQLWKVMRAKNACKTCALGMGGQAGGMLNELGHWPEVCKKSLQAMVADMQQGLQPEFFQRYSIAELHSLSSRELEYCGRLTQPLHAGPGDTHYRVIDWDTALDRVARQLRDGQPDQNFFYCSGRSSNEAGFLLQLFARLYGTNFVNNCSYYCHQASGVALNDAVGTGTSTVTLDDLENADLFFLIGGNPASNHPRLMRTLMNIRRHNGQVIVINPVKEIGLVNFSVPSDLRSLFFGSEIASLYVQPHIGGDIALLTGVAKLVLERNRIDAGFIAEATEGFERYAEQVRNTSWLEIEQQSGVARALIEKMADSYQRLDDGHHASRARRGQCSGNHQPGLATRHGGAAGRRPSADPRPLQRARHRLGRCRAQSQAGRPRQPANDPRCTTADNAGARHDGVHAGSKPG